MILLGIVDNLRSELFNIYKDKTNETNKQMYEMGIINKQITINKNGK